MHIDHWLEAWNVGRIGFHQTTFNRHLEAYWGALGIAPGTPVFVPLAGKSLDMLWLRGQGYPVIGVEVSSLAVEAFFRENRLQPEKIRERRLTRWIIPDLTLLEADFFALEPGDLAWCGAIYDRASLIAFPPRMRPDYARQLQALRGGGPTLLVTLDYDTREMAGPPFAVSESEVETLFSARYAIERLYAADVLDERPRFRARGLTRLTEQVYRLSPRPPGA
jgi:thiopurine S-methyltransferase